jgi:predicted transposase YbfD/YdcC
MIADEYLSVGQKVVGEKSNEIPVVAELLDILDIKGSVVTMDAMHCQKETVEKVIKNGGDYVVQLKGNQGNFYKDVYAMFDDKYMDEADKDGEYEKFQTIEKGHGRIEKRTCYVLQDIEYFTDYMADWKGLKKIFAVKRTVEKGGKITEEISCYLSSKNTSAENLLSYTRKHWQIESFHWLLDVVMGVDGSFLRDKTAQDCMNRMSKFAISVMKKYIEHAKPKKKSISGNMRLCLLSSDYLEKVLCFFLRIFLLQLCYGD